MGEHLSSRAALSCTLALGSLVAGPVNAWASPPVAEQVGSDAVTEVERIRVIIDTSRLSKSDSERIRPYVYEQVIGYIEAEGFSVTSKKVPTTLRVRIEYLDQEDLEYAVHYDIQRDVGASTDVPWVACVACVDAALLRKIEEGLPPALARIRQLTPSEPEPVEQPPTTDEPTKPAPAPIGGLEIAGAVLAGVGLGVVIGGGVEYGRGVEVEGESDQTRFRVDHRIPGGVMLGVGSAALLVGVALLATDLGKRAKQRKSADKREARVLPILGPGTVGLGFVGNF